MTKKKKLLLTLRKNSHIYLLLLPAVALTVIFSYLPLAGIKMAFQDYNIYNPAASVWCGLKNFKAIINMPDCLSAVINTLKINMLSLFICFPITVIFALLVNELGNIYFKKTIQTISYLPHFLSWISVIALITTLYSEGGMINNFLVAVGGKRFEGVNLLAKQWFFIPNVIILTIWKSIGWNSIIFLAAITGVDQSLFEAATIDGASRFKQVVSIILPCIMPTIMIMLLWRIAALFGDNFELIYGLQNPYVNVEVIGTYIYKNGIAGGNYQTTTAFGIMQGVINFAFLIMANAISKKTTDVGIL